MKELDQGYEFTKAQLAELEQLRQRVNELESDVVSVTEQKNKMWFELAASQLENLRMRSALERWKEANLEGEISTLNHAYKLREEALSTPTDTEALLTYRNQYFRLGAEYAFETTGVNTGLTVTDTEIAAALKEKP